MDTIAGVKQFVNTVSFSHFICTIAVSLKVTELTPVSMEKMMVLVLQHHEKTMETFPLCKQIADTQKGYLFIVSSSQICKTEFLSHISKFFDGTYYSNVPSFER